MLSGILRPFVNTEKATNSTYYIAIYSFIKLAEEILLQVNFISINDHSTYFVVCHVLNSIHPFHPYPPQVINPISSRVFEAHSLPVESWTLAKHVVTTSVSLNKYMHYIRSYQLRHLAILKHKRKMSPVRVTKMRWNWIRRNLLLILTFSGVICGVGCGFIIRVFEPDKTVILLLAYPGELFIRMLKLMILPLVIASLIAGSASLNAKCNGRIVIRTIMDNDLGGFRSTDSNVNILDGFLDLGRNIFPDNLFQASFQQVQYRSGTNTLGIIVFCLVFGTILGSMGKKGAVVVQFFSTVDAVILKIAFSCRCGKR
ncbi:Excitatory amino acid transporter [Armadillidium nasatum]|uniref:Amino acid transporter n=1 Tax=Armadillidium nasatum TaxID=96803 RepID=A0A5N5TP23_9CRUS|nr:Excitatory amino acid transporter [Armadillidium nasatum]